MIAASDDSRERLLAAAWDEVCEPYALPGYPSILLRPFSANTLRRASTMRLLCLAGDFREVLAALPPSRALGEIEAVAWLLTSDLDALRAAMRAQSWETALDHYELPREAIAPFRDELVRVLALLTAAMFATEEKPAPSPVAGRGTHEPPDPPAHLVSPGLLATLGFSLAEKVGRPVDETLEWVPACQLFQLAHCLQWGNTAIWTVAAGAIPEGVDPWEGIAPGPDPGYGDAIDF